MAIPLANHELATTLKPAASTMLHYAIVFYLSFSSSAKQHGILFGHFPSTFDNLSYIPVQSSILWWFWSGQQASIGTLEVLWHIWVSFPASISGHSSDSAATWMMAPCGSFILEVNSSYARRKAAGQAGQNCWVDTGQNHIFQTWIHVCDSSSTCSACSKEVWNFTKRFVGAKGEPFEICSFVPSTKLASGNSACKASFNTPASMNKTASRDSSPFGGPFVLERNTVFWTNR